MTRGLATTRSRPAIYRPDARPLVGDLELARLAREAAAATAPLAWPDLGIPGDRRPRVGQWELVALLTYCYASEIYPSEEVESHLATSRQLRRLFGDLPATAHELRKCRRRHRDWLVACLAWVLSRIQPAVPPFAESADRGRGGYAEPLRSGWLDRGGSAFEHEAHSRLLCAARADSAALDD